MAPLTSIHIALASARIVDHASPLFPQTYLPLFVFRFTSPTTLSTCTTNAPFSNYSSHLHIYPSMPFSSFKIAHNLHEFLVSRFFSNCTFMPCLYSCPQSGCRSCTYLSKTTILTGTHHRPIISTTYLS